MNEKLSISKENIDLIRSLVMYSDDDLGFFRQIKDYLYRLSDNIESYENQQKYQKTLHELFEVLNEVYKK